MLKPNSFEECNCDSLSKYPLFHYFTDFEKEKSIKIGICALIGKISKQISSHKAGWAHMIANQLKTAGYDNVTVINRVEDDWSNYDVILIDHGMEYKGAFNIFGGANNELYMQICRLFRMSYNTRLYSLNINMPDVSELVKVRLRTGTDLFKKLESSIDRIKDICSRIPRIDFVDRSDKQILGDSHSFSLYRPGWNVTRYDGLTLHGVLERRISNFLLPQTKNLMVYFGNIDVRHHLMRQQDPIASIDKLMADYELQLKDLNMESITVSHVLPVENESRKIPKTGWYKKSAYFGTQKDRAALSFYINKKIDAMCELNGWSVYKVPTNFFNAEGELTFDVMEKPQSVHISREFHYWDYEENKPNARITQ